MLINPRYSRRNRNHRAPQLLILDRRENRRKPQRLRLGNELKRRRLAARKILRPVRHAAVRHAQQREHVHLQYVRDPQQPAARHPVLAALIFLHLLKGDAERGAELGLRHSPGETVKPDVAADRAIGTVRALTHDLLPASSTMSAATVQRFCAMCYRADGWVRLLRFCDDYLANLIF